MCVVYWYSIQYPLHLRVFASRGRVRFKKALHQFLDKEGYGWVAESGDAFCAMLQAAVAKAAKNTVTSGKGTVSTNVADYAKKDLQVAFANALVTTSVLLELIANSQTARGASCRSREDGRDGGGAAACSSGCQAPDAGKPHRRPFSARCSVPQCLRDASHYQAQVHSKTPEVTKILQGEKLTTASQSAEKAWLIPTVLMYGRLAYKFEGMTDMMNGVFTSPSFSTRPREINVVASLSKT